MGDDWTPSKAPVGDVPSGPTGGFVRDGVPDLGLEAPRAPNGGRAARNFGAFEGARSNFLEKMGACASRLGEPQISGFFRHFCILPAFMCGRCPGCVYAP